jgi:hypothetical protein
MHATCPVHIITLDIIYEAPDYVIFSSPVSSFLLGANILLGALFSNTLHSHSSPRAGISQCFPDLWAHLSLRRPVFEELNKVVRFHVLTAPSMKMTAFWDTVPCSFMELDRRLRGVYCLHHQNDGSTSTRLLRNITEGCHLDIKLDFSFMCYKEPMWQSLMQVHNSTFHLNPLEASKIKYLTGWTNTVSSLYGNFMHLVYTAHKHVNKYVYLK